MLSCSRFSASSGRVLSSDLESGVHKPLSLPRREGTFAEDSADHMRFATGGSVGGMTLQEKCKRANSLVANRRVLQLFLCLWILKLQSHGSTSEESRLHESTTIQVHVIELVEDHTSQKRL